MTPDDKREIRAAFLRSACGKIFLAGCCMLLVWIGLVAGLWRAGSDRWTEVLTVGFAHLLAGRAISIAQGTHVGLPAWAITIIATYADIMGMLIVYPIFIYSYENFFEGRFFQTRMKPMLDSARRGVDRFHGGKILGVFFFVWLPFWMTGIIIGAILGYLLGLRTWVTLATAACGTLAAVASWVYAYDIVFRWLGEVHQEIALIVVIVILLGLFVFRVLKARKMRREASAANEL